MWENMQLWEPILFFFLSFLYVAARSQAPITVLNGHFGLFLGRGKQTLPCEPRKEKTPQCLRDPFDSSPNGAKAPFGVVVVTPVAKEFSPFVEIKSNIFFFGNHAPYPAASQAQNPVWS